MAKQSVVKRKQNPGFLIPLALALIVTILFYVGAQKKTQADIHPVQVPVAKVILAQHTKITEADIVMITIPIKGVPPNIVTNPKDLLDKYVGTQYTIPKNGYFYKDSVSTLADIPSNISMMLGPNQLGVTLQMNLEKSVANSLTEGQDVQVRFFTNKTPNQQPFEGVLFDRLKILALRNSSGVNVKNTDDQKTTQVPTVVVFQANDEQVSYLIRSQSLGSLNIVAIPKDTTGSPSPADTTKDTSGSPSPADTTKDSNSSSTGGSSSTSSLEGHLYQKNAAELLIDSMSYTIQQLFAKSGILATSNGEIVYFDAATNQVRYFKDKSEYQESVYSLSQLTPEQVTKLKQDGKLTDAQIQALAAQQKASQEPRYSETTKGELYQILNGQAVFSTNAAVIKALEDLKLKNGSLGPDNQALLGKLKGSGTDAGNGTSTGTGQ